MNNVYKLCRCDMDQVDDILTLQDIIFAELGDNTDILRKNTRQMFESCVREPNITLGIYKGEELYGIAILVDVRGSEEDLSLHLKKIKAEGLKSVNFKLIMLRKACYGLKFQRTIVALFETIAARRGYDLICATVALDNLYSRNNLLDSGYQVDHTEEKYGGLLRDVCYKMIDRQITVKENPHLQFELIDFL